MSIVFFQESNCPYTVYFDTDKETNLSIVQKVQACTQRSFHLIHIFFLSLKDSVCKNVGGANTSFKYIVLGYYGPLRNFHLPKDIYLVVFKIVFWVAAMGWGTVETTARLFIERTSTGHSLFLKQFASDEMNVDHIKTEELVLDASSVSENIKVNTLKDLFKATNFTDKRAPGYMPPGTRQEEGGVFTVEKLEENLETFIRRINTREAFLGTPPARDIPRLMDFYQQIEDAVRLSIHKAKKDLDAFKEQNKTNLANLSVEKKHEYNDLLQAQARVALDLSMAGAHCGARYMGDAMDVYYNIYNKEGIPKDKDLQGTLIEILAKKREEIAKGQIQEELGNDAHQFTKYMSNLGKLLGIPGTKNIMEHLSKSIDTYRLLELFFQEYTVDTIIDAVQEKIKTSQDFREKMIDWIKNQAKDWNLEKYQKIDAAALVKRIKEIRMEEIPMEEIQNDSKIKSIKTLQTLIVKLKKEVLLPEMKKGWDHFLIEFLALKRTKEELSFQERNELQKNCSEATLGSELVKELQQALELDNFTPVFLDPYLPGFIEKAKIEKMKTIFTNEYEIPIEQDTLSRLLQDEVGLITVIQNQKERARQNEFLNSFDLEEMAENGLSKELIEWVLVSQRILNPQIISDQDEVKYTNLKADQIQAYVNVVHQGFNSRIQNNSAIPIEAKELMTLESLLKLLSTRDKNPKELSNYTPILDLKEKRYRDTRLKKERILTQIFNQSFQYDSNKVIAAAEKASKRVFYPNWKKVCWIQLPKAFADLFSNLFFKIALMVSTIAISSFSIYQAYVKVKLLFITRGVPFIINYVSLQIIRAGNALIVAKEFIWKHSLKIVVAAWLVKKGIESLPEIPYLSAAARTIAIWEMVNIFWFPQTLFDFILSISLNAAEKIYSISQGVSYRFHRISSNAEKERLILCKQKSLAVWRSC